MEIIGRDQPAAFVMESSPSPSRCSSGCQSGWTLYLDHSDGHRCITLEPAQSWMVPHEGPADEDDDHDDDSMVSDASSGPTPRLLDEDDGEQRRHFCDHRCYSSGSSGVPGSASSAASSGSYGSWSRGAQDQAAARRAAVVRGVEATRQYCNVAAEDDLDDTASSSAVLSCPCGHGVHCSSWKHVQYKLCAVLE